jgi:tRNA/tmRNA/rRNA uracil-C5-methylase (TrmA/RlmC/RlmD family)
MTDAPALGVGDERIVETGSIAHGGHVIAHSDGRTLFVRHALPGESVRVRVTEVNKRIVRADAVEVITSSPDRVAAPCPWARPDACGGCDFQHVGLPAQRALKTTVLVDALTRFGKVNDFADRVTVEELPGAPDGLHWRTRMRWGVTRNGDLGLRAHRRHRVVPVDSCLLAAPGLDVQDIDPAPRDADEVVVALGSDGKVGSGHDRVRQQVNGREWRTSAASFWQVHPALAGALQAEVLAQGRPQAGQTWWDLYCGAGLLSAALAERVGEAGRIDAVELSHESIREGRRALHDLPQVRLHTQDVIRWLRNKPVGQSPDGVVLDPPRAGAGADVVNAIADHAPPVVVYVACDPVALGRDVALFAERGYRLDEVRAFDAFPMTHHFETVARLVRLS